jgi:hypothetical protein
VQRRKAKAAEWVDKHGGTEEAPGGQKSRSAVKRNEGVEEEEESVDSEEADDDAWAMSDGGSGEGGGEGGEGVGGAFGKLASVNAEKSRIGTKLEALDPKPSIPTLHSKHQDSQTKR